MASTADKEHILFITGKLAYQGVNEVLESMSCAFTYDVHDIGVSVAALMTTDIIKRRLKSTYDADRVILPGRFRGRLDELSAHFNIPFERGPEEYKDLPQFFGQEATAYSMDHYNVSIFAEIVDAPNYTPEQTLAMAQVHRHYGADIIDLGFLPDTPFPQIHDTIELLKQNGFKVSVDTHDPKDLLAAANSGADYLLSLKRDTLWVADETDAVPIIIPDTPQAIDTLYQAIDVLLAKGKPFIVDPILDPIHCGFTASIVRYAEMHRRYPQVEVMMGIGNLTELTHADSAGVTAILMGIISELNIKYILTTAVSEHCCMAVKEADIARRIMASSHKAGTPPANINDQLMMLHERKPFPFSEGEIKAFAASVKDRNFRIQVTDKGIHIYNRDLYKTVKDPYDVYTNLGVADDGGHAFYLGVELARAQIAHQLGKRYTQDEELKWGCAVEQTEEDMDTFKEFGPTKSERIKKQKKDKK